VLFQFVNHRTTLADAVNRAAQQERSKDEMFQHDKE